MICLLVSAGQLSLQEFLLRSTLKRDVSVGIIREALVEVVQHEEIGDVTSDLPALTPYASMVHSYGLFVAPDI